jgi:hypothetical protein
MLCANITATKANTRAASIFLVTDRGLTVFFKDPMQRFIVTNEKKGSQLFVTGIYQRIQGE